MKQEAQATQRLFPVSREARIFVAALLSAATAIV
jgi:hypothetical protein